HPGPPAPSRHDGQHQGGQLPVAGEEEGRPARAQAQARGRPRGRGARGGGGSPRVSQRTRTSVNRGHLTSVISGQLTSALTPPSLPILRGEAMPRPALPSRIRSVQSTPAPG